MAQRQLSGRVKNHLTGLLSNDGFVFVGDASVAAVVAGRLMSSATDI